MSKQDLEPYRQNLQYKQVFEDLGVNLAEVFEFTPMDLDLENRRLENLLNFTLKYSTDIGDGELYAYTDWTYRSSYNFFLYEAPEYKAKTLLEGGARIGYKWDKYEVAAFARNLTDKRVIIGAIDFDNLTGMLNEPRTIGATFKVNF